MALPDLTLRQSEALKFICAHIDLHGKAPASREIMVRLKWSSPNRTTVVVAALVKKGLLVKKLGVSRNVGRNLVVTKLGQEWFNAQPPEQTEPELPGLQLAER